VKSLTVFFTCLVLFSLKCLGQDQAVMPLANPSFEEVPDWENGWKSCASLPPVIQPGSFKVESPASDGEAYLALVVRDDNTREAVSQKLPVALREGQVYQLSADLMRSEIFFMEATTKTQMVNYDTPVILRIWGGNNPCEKQELLHTTPLITTTQWLPYTLALEPQEGDYDYLTLEASHKTAALFPYNGNLLIDNLVLTYWDIK
jgi:hypothetical protein